MKNRITVLLALLPLIFIVQQFKSKWNIFRNISPWLLQPPSDYEVAINVVREQLQSIRSGVPLRLIMPTLLRTSEKHFH